MLVGAYYYGWYEKDWLCRTVRKNDPPILGEYNNKIISPVLDEQMKQIKSSGIDFLSISYQGEDHGHIIDAAAKYGIRVTFFYESLWRGGKDSVPFENLNTIVCDVKGISEFMNEPNWLRIDGRPVLMFYVTRCFCDKPKEIFRAIRRESPDIYIVGDELFWDDVPDERIRMFDAVTSYNLYQTGRFSVASPEETRRTYLDTGRKRMASHAKRCNDLGVPIWGNAMPGYNDNGVRPECSHPLIARDEGRFFESSLTDALSISNDCMMITSYNEWYEDTQIEPAISYGNQYGNLIKNFKQRSKS